MAVIIMITTELHVQQRPTDDGNKFVCYEINYDKWFFKIIAMLITAYKLLNNPETSHERKTVNKLAYSLKKNTFSAFSAQSCYGTSRMRWCNDL